jgi:hypothetical protein
VQGADGVVELLAALVVAAHALAQHLQQPGVVDLGALLARGGDGQRLQRVEQPARVAVGVGDQAGQRRRRDGGVDPRYVARRMIRMAVEDIGLADPRALRLALDAADVYERLGSPEGELALAECLVYLAVAPKSNAVYAAYNEARALVRKDGTRPVPLHLRNAPTRLMKDLGYGKEYRYAHDEEGGFAAGENYFPEGMKAPRFYRPVERGLEIRIAEKLRELRERNQAAPPRETP